MDMNDFGFSEEDIRVELDSLDKEFPDSFNMNNKKVSGSNEKLDVIQGIFYKAESKKRSWYKNMIYQNCNFENNSFTGSTFQNIDFVNTMLKGNGFISCSFYNSSFSYDSHIQCVSNNFSQSNLTECSFSNVTFLSCGLLQTDFSKCTFHHCKFQSSTLEGTIFRNCQFHDTDMSRLNLDFITFTNTLLNNVTFPFYQFPYVIGAADYLIQDDYNIFFKAGDKTINLCDYKEQCSKIIKYFYMRSEYFPMCNLYIALRDMEKAKVCLETGITNALEDLDFRMIRFFCKLGKRYDLFHEQLTQKILKQLDDFIIHKKIPLVNLNTCLIHTGEIRALLLGNNYDEVSLQLNIRTNIPKDNAEGLKYIHTFVQQITMALSQQQMGQSGYDVSVSNYSPFEILINVVGGIGSVTAISKFIWDIVAAVKEKSSSHKNNEEFEKLAEIEMQKSKMYIETRIEQYKNEMITIQQTYKKKEMSPYIEEVTQKLKTDIDNLYSKDIAIFTIKNNTKE